MNRCRFSTTIAAIGLTLGSSLAYARESGIQVSPDQKRILINKDINGEQWIITHNLDDNTITGNVVAADGTPVFFWCQILSDDGTNTTMSCSTANTCDEGPCSSDEWDGLGNIQVADSFLTPPAGPPPPAKCPTDGPLTNLQTDCRTVGYYYQSAIEVAGLATSGQVVVLVVVSKNNSNPPIGLSGNVVNATAFNLTAACQLDGNGNPTQCATVSATGSIADSGRALNVTLQGQIFSYGFVKASPLQQGAAALAAAIPRNATDNLAGTIAAPLMPALKRELETAAH
jgi:hypothetical protein